MKLWGFLIIAVIVSFFLINKQTRAKIRVEIMGQKVEKAVFAGGCFWCIERDFEKLDGVIQAQSGYAGGTASTATYEMVSGGITDHFEVIEVTYDPSQVSYKTLVEYFYKHVDPLDAKGQFCDKGDQYRSAIFYKDEAEMKTAREVSAWASEKLGQAVVTTLEKLDQFYLAEGYHQNYAKRNPIRYNYYRRSCGRDKRVKAVWGK